MLDLPVFVLGNLLDHLANVGSSLDVQNPHNLKSLFSGVTQITSRIYVKITVLASRHSKLLRATPQITQDSNYARFSLFSRDTLQLHPPRARARSPPQKTGTVLYRIKLVIVRIMVIVMLDVEVNVSLVVILEVVVDVSLGGGGGDAAPGEEIVPANAGAASAMLRIATAQVWRRLFTLGAPSKRCKSFASRKMMQTFCIAP